MALSHLHLHFHTPLSSPPFHPPLSLSTLKPFHFRFTTNPYVQHSIPLQNPKFPLRCSHYISEIGARNPAEKNPYLFFRLRRWFLLFRSLFPGGDWWDFCELRGIECEMGSRVRVFPALRKIWVLVAGDRWVIFAAFASLTVAALAEISMPRLLTVCIFAAQNHESIVFYRNSLFLVLLCLTSGVCSGLRGGCFGIANMTLVKHLRETLYSVLLFQDISFFDTEAVGNLTSRLGADCQRLSRVIGNDIHMIIRNILQGTGALFNLMMLSRPLALSSIAVCFILSFIFLIYGQYQKRAAKITQEFEVHANEVADEAFSLVRTIKVYGTEKESLARYKQWLDKLIYVNLRESVAYGFWNLSFNTLYRSTQVLAVAFGGISILTGHVSPEQLTKYILYCEWLIYATWRLADNCVSLLQSVGASERLFQLIDLLPRSQFSSKGIKLQKLNGSVEFVDVSFRYPTRMEAPVLEHVNISIPPSKTVAIVGPSGSGKSTLIKLLLRLYEPTQGEILIDGFPLKDLDVKWLRSEIGYIAQEPHLFHMDVKSNITYGCLRDISQEDVEWATKLANAHDFISSLPNGYNTLVNDDLLSRGQKQRIAIARAILRRPSILILDEPTSALDAKSEHYITDVLHTMKSDFRKETTVILIAHRLSALKVADRILVMEDGNIVEEGTHEELVHKDRLYTRLFRLQLQG